MTYPCDSCRSWRPGLLADHQIRHLANEHGMIRPYEAMARRTNDAGEKVLSFGQGSFGYDVRVLPKWKVFTPRGKNVVLDPKNMDPAAFVDADGPSVDIPPNGFVLAVSVEEFDMPSDVTSIVFTKSSYARAGIAMQLTPLEAGWRGFVTVEIGNTTPHWSRVYANEGIAQVLFLKGSAPCDKTYANKNENGAAGKYQDQKAEITLPRL